MAFDYSKHKNIQLRMLKDIYTDTAIAPHLGFKGGTAALLFYHLNRYSVDLDFDLLDERKEKEVFEKLETIARGYGDIRESRLKRYSAIIILSYDARAQNIKIEVNRRTFGSRYELKTLLGISMLVQVAEDMFANKLMALYERLGKTSRDVFDVYFFAKNNWPINRKIVEKRAGMPYAETAQKCIELLERMNNRSILDGLGEFLTESQKDWARAKLRSETIFLLKARLESDK
ncbi:MAG: nucleotidyl transferase AbiEii/AbiGii toxin family protein [Parcubacteria group bacterium]|nr:nucleotidyl transferase AbiEii/AbiGii toxin family protein [Parcubacteria group bacterium]